MRVLDTSSGEFAELKPKGLPYAILSHTWDENGEQSHQDVRDIQHSWDHRSRSFLVLARQAVFFGFFLIISRIFHIVAVALCHGHLTGSLTFRLCSSRRQHFVSQLKNWSGIFRDTSMACYFPFTMLMDTALSEKLRGACAVALADGYRYIWIDSCCIDKTSSSELSEAINSMYLWYRDTVICYAYLADVLSGEDPRAPDSSFRRSRWFTRGWTLQELIAPRRVVFLAQDWHILGTKHSLGDVVAEVTGIDYDVLAYTKSLDAISVATRMSWASNRKTTRVEDEAYSLLGIFDIIMTPVYGEGERAFRRLQEEILKRIPDQTLFAWGSIYAAGPLLSTGEATDSALTLPGDDLLRICYIEPHPQLATLFAPSPSSFAHARDIHPIPRAEFSRLLGLEGLPFEEYATSPSGIRTHFPLVVLKADHALPVSINIRFGANPPVSDTCLVLLACWDSEQQLLARICEVRPGNGGPD
ncbi:hypothetical protein LXA43DRAFT_950792, partial [Ganoderma leucocontextum]